MQKLINGEGSVEKIGALISGTKDNLVFLITGKHFLQNHDLDFLRNFNVQHYIKQGSNVEEVEIGLATKLFQQSGAETIIAIGGGSVIDLAKAIIYELRTSIGFVPNFLVAPTTAGSGSEATSFAVVYRNKKKISLIDPQLLPPIVILDPSLIYSLSTYQLAVSGMDALAQAIESYWNRNATPESRTFATEAIKSWKENFFLALTHKDKNAMAKMLMAAHLAGKAINITRTTGPHALSYYLTARFNVPHGQAVSLFLPVFILYNPPDTSLFELLGVKNEADAARWVRDTMKEAGLATTFSELGINKDDILDELLKDVNEERFANNPSPFDSKRLRQMLDELI